MALPGLTSAVLGLLGTLGLASTAQAANERPSYTVVSQHDGWEVREYAPQLQARVTVQGEYNVAISRGFRVLAKYIFGGNRPQAKIDMTAPVTATPGTTGASIAMTAPVTAQPAGSTNSMGAKTWTVTFMMPRAYTLDTLPEPLDDRVKIVPTEPERMAVRTFSWWASRSRSDEQIQALVTQVQAAGLTMAGPPRVAQFEAPWVPGPLRTNEVLIPLVR